MAEPSKVTPSGQAYPVCTLRRPLGACLQGLASKGLALRTSALAVHGCCIPSSFWSKSSSPFASQNARVTSCQVNVLLLLSPVTCWRCNLLLASPRRQFQLVVACTAITAQFTCPGPRGTVRLPFPIISELFCRLYVSKGLLLMTMSHVAVFPTESPFMAHKGHCPVWIRMCSMRWPAIEKGQLQKTREKAAFLCWRASAQWGGLSLKRIHCSENRREALLSECKCA